MKIAEEQLNKVDELVKDLRDSLKKRTLIFVNDELRKMNDRIMDAKAAGDTDTLQNLLYEVMFLQSTTDRVLKLKL